MDDVIAKKSLGQHWLVDNNVLDSICEIAKISKNDKILEIGPGKGALTKKILDNGGFVTAIEVDKESVSYLNNTLKDYRKDRLVIIHSDIRKFDFRQMGSNYKIVANIPYYLTSNLIQIISESHNQPSLVVLLVQKEVANRICAQEGNLSILGITTQYFWETSLGTEVKPESFYPAPKVNSQVVILKKRKIKLFDVDEKKFFKLIKCGFSAKRKTLLNSLSGGLRIPKQSIIEYLDLAGVPYSLRPQDLSLVQWKSIYDEIEEVI